MKNPKTTREEAVWFVEWFSDSHSITQADLDLTRKLRPVDRFFFVGHQTTKDDIETSD